MNGTRGQQPNIFFFLVLALILEGLPVIDCLFFMLHQNSGGGGGAKFSTSSNKGPVVSPKLLMLKSLNMVGASRHLPIYGRTKVCNHGLELVNF